MISSEDSNVPRVLNFQGKEILEGFYRAVSSINVITKEDVAGVRYFSPCSEEL
jgi:hypothetical protein